MLERSSAIASGLARGGRQPKASAGCRLGEVRGWALLQVAGFPASIARIELALAATCGCGVPGQIGRVARARATMLLRTGPEQIWIIGSGETLQDEPAIRADVAPGMGVLTPLSHSRTRMFVDGPRARDVLAKGFTIDLHSDVFAVDQFALTGLDHTPVLLHRAAADRYEIYAMRTFALTVWDWLADAALEWGYEVVT